MFKELLPSFSSELAKLANNYAELVDKHHKNKDWKEFDKHIKNKAFQKAVIKHNLSDEDLKKFVSTVGEYRNSKNIVAEVPSRTSSKKYKIKRLSSGRLACPCKDWTYKRSIRDEDCYHIKTLRKEKSAAIMPLLRAAIPRAAGVSHHIFKARESYKKGKEMQENTERLKAM